MKIGKKVSGNLYIHKSASDTLSDTEERLVLDAKEIYFKAMGKEIGYDILKINVKTNCVSFILSPDWNIAREPIVGEAVFINIAEKKVKIMKQKKNPQIYHHKWQFVKPDYLGFDIEREKAWSKKWESIIPKEYKNKIGYKNFWEGILKEFKL